LITAWRLIFNSLAARSSSSSNARGQVDIHPLDRTHH
jgi:hypothetical protein